MLKKVYLPPSSYETCFISSAHKEADLDETLDAFRHFSVGIVSDNHMPFYKLNMQLLKTLLICSLGMGYVHGKRKIHFHFREDYLKDLISGFLKVARFP